MDKIAYFDEMMGTWNNCIPTDLMFREFEGMRTGNKVGNDNEVVKVMNMTTKLMMSGLKDLDSEIVKQKIMVINRIATFYHNYLCNNVIEYKTRTMKFKNAMVYQSIITTAMPYAVFKVGDVNDDFTISVTVKNIKLKDLVMAAELDIASGVMNAMPFIISASTDIPHENIGATLHKVMEAFNHYFMVIQNSHESLLRDEELKGLWCCPEEKELYDNLFQQMMERLRKESRFASVVAVDNDKNFPNKNIVKVGNQPN